MRESEVIIIGGGLAGLTAAIHLSKKGIPVVLFEKESFPHHKVCGEYVSKEILPYFEQLEIPLWEIAPMEINRLLFSTASGKSMEANLPLGGLGLSRYAFDDLLYREALKNKVEVVKATVVSMKFSTEKFELTTSENKKFKAKVVLGAFGKRSNLDKELKRSFFQKQAPWLAVKSHYKKEGFPTDLVGLHSFKGGYCGLSKTETGAVNACYLATYKSFKAHKNPEKFKKNVLEKNPILAEFFFEATPIFEHPLTIAQVSFNKKNSVENHILMLGDAAGLLHPLSGNGMAIAIHSAKIASETVLKYISNPSFEREQMEKEYAKQWDYHFQSRIETGKRLQKILLNDNLAAISHSLISKMPFLLQHIIKRTHGKSIE